MERLVSDLVLCYSLFLSGLLLACLAQATRWNGEPPLKKKYKEHEFLAACREGNLPAVEYYLRDRGVKADECFISGVSGDSITGLILTAQEGHLTLTEFLLQNGATVNWSTTGGITPLHKAAECGHVAIVRIFLHNGALPDPKDQDDWSPLLYAAANGHGEVVKSLLDARADPNQQLSDGCTPLFFAAQNGHREVVSHLVTAGANPNLMWRLRGFPWKTAWVAAWQKRPLFRRWNPDRYDHYTGIMTTLKQAKQEWRHAHGDTIQSRGIRSLFARRQRPEQTVTEQSPLLPAVEKLLVSGK